MNNYKIATVPESSLPEITQLENKIKQLTGTNIVLIAYEPEESEE